MVQRNDRAPNSLSPEGNCSAETHRHPISISPSCRHAGNLLSGYGHYHALYLYGRQCPANKAQPPLAHAPQAVLSRRFGAALEHLTRLFRRGEGQSLAKGHGRGIHVHWLPFGVIFGKLWLKIIPIRIEKKGALTPVVFSDAKCLAAFA